MDDASSSRGIYSKGMDKGHNIMPIHIQVRIRFINSKGISMGVGA
jgi:hypothetical protein